MLLFMIDVRKVAKVGSILLLDEFLKFPAISPNAGSIILRREAQQRHSQNSSPNRFHSSDMRAFLESMPNVANACCFSFLELIGRKKIKDKATTTG